LELELELKLELIHYPKTKQSIFCLRIMNNGNDFLKYKEFFILVLIAFNYR